MDRDFGGFTWDVDKEKINVAKHGVDFIVASKVFSDPKRKIFANVKHSKTEDRFYCIGNVDGRILTVRFVYRDKKIRIFGAGYWRGGKKHYEAE